jgi:hypothetical protein
MDETKGNDNPKSDEAAKENSDTLAASAIKEENKIKEYPVSEEEAYETEEIVEEDNKMQIVEPQQGLLNSPIKNINTLSEIHNLAEALLGGKMCSFKSVADGVITLIAGKELGLSLAATLGGIYAIEGRPSLGVHIKKGILLQNNVLFKRTHDMEPYYEFVDFNIVDAEEAKKLNKAYTPSIIGYGFLSDLPKYKALAEYEVKKRSIDTRTEYLFTRYFKTPKGIVKNTATGIFGVADAKQAGLLEKNNWKNYLRDMLSSRAFSRGANEIADDLLHGMLSFSELADVNDSITYYIDENGHEQIVK